MHLQKGGEESHFPMKTNGITEQKSSGKTNPGVVVICSLCRARGGDGTSVAAHHSTRPSRLPFSGRLATFVFICDVFGYKIKTSQSRRA